MIDWRQQCGWLEEYENYLQLTGQITDQSTTEKTMDINQEFPSKYLKAADLQGRTLKVVVDRVERGDETIGGKPVMYMVGKEKGIVLNKTNSMALASKFGPETDGWRGKEVELYSQMVNFNNQMVDALRVRAKVDVPEGDDDEIPF